MFILNFILLLYSSPSFATSVQCHLIFNSKEALAAKNDDIRDPAMWFAGLQQKNEISREQLQTMIKVGKINLRKGTYTPRHQEVFRFIVNLKKSDLALLTAPDLIDIYKLFSHWNLSPPSAFQTRLWTTMTQHIPHWTAKDHLNFALARKLNPLDPSPKFLTAWKSSFLKNFSQLDATTQLEVLGAELLHQTKFSSAQTRNLLVATTNSVLAEKKPLNIKPLKEMFRGLMVLRALEPSHFFVPMVRLEQAIEQHLHALGLSLDQAGRSGDASSDTTLRSVPPLRLWVEQQLNMAFGFMPKIYEHTNAAHLGFFDPVDIFFPDIHLVVEWDGPHHYFNKMDPQGKIIFGYDQLVLRPMDRARDAILRRNGHSILRIPVELNREIKSLNIVELIKRQNPNFEGEH